MQKKRILVLSLLAFAIAMELVFILHLLGQPQGSQNRLSLSAQQPTLASTIALTIAPPQNPGRTPPGATAPGGAPETAMDAAYPAGPDALLATLEESPTAGEPALEDPSGGAAAMDAYPAPEEAPPVYLDEPFQEPADSEPGWSEPLPEGAPPVEPPPVEEPPAEELPEPPLAEETQAPAEPTAPVAQPSVAAPSTPAPGQTATPPAPGKTPAPPQPSAAPSPTQPPATATAPPGAPLLVSVRAGDAPRLDGSGDDAAWKAAPVTTLDTRGGANHSATRVTLQSVYDDKRVYFLLTWADPSHSFLRNPWEKQPDGKWKKLIDPANQGSDENRYYEDQLALFWPIKNRPDDFATRGCGGACHSGENPDAKAYGAMYTAERGQVYDLWQWKSVRNVGQVDDRYLDATRYSSDTPSAGFHNDPSAGGGYRSNQDNNQPAYMPPKGGDRSGAPGYILESEKETLQAKLFKPGDRVPGILVEAFKGDRGDLSAGWRYRDGAWTLEISRKRVTGSKYDVQFEDLSQAYWFALATFDNTQVRHAVQETGAQFRFRQ